MVPHVRALVVVASLGFVQCALLTDLDGLTGGTTSSAPDEAGARETSSDAIADAASETGADAGADASVEFVGARWVSGASVPLTIDRPPAAMTGDVLLLLAFSFTSGASLSAPTFTALGNLSGVSGKSYGCFAAYQVIGPATPTVVTVEAPTTPSIVASVAIVAYRNVRITAGDPTSMYTTRYSSDNPRLLPTLSVSEKTKVVALFGVDRQETDDQTWNAPSEAAARVDQAQILVADFDVPSGGLSPELPFSVNTATAPPQTAVHVVALEPPR